MASLLREQSSTRLAKVSRQKNEQEQVISKVKEKTKNKFYVGETATQRKRRLEKKRQKYRDKLLSETKAEKRLRLEERRDKRKAESTEQRGVRLYRDRQRKRLGRSETLEQIQRGKFQMTPNQLKKISLDENGTFMSDFDPERSKREMRKLNRKIHKENKKLNQMYDETGRLLENSLDICDCLDKDCPGCHFPCPKCASEKCGAECRSGRRWTYEQVEVEGTNLVFKWSSTTAS
ncbi:ARL14 effector protein-like isoform X2 [Pomacea canaliculata]|uniref:ARL14 effector protein-like isoform X2 n=1 Tax=Pomacea canaliculata TaxID=400727 RepID=UPI000D72E4BA|nr:ARL14 effector protein-like isoform X2 [Pomacea canaliculata]